MFVTSTRESIVQWEYDGWTNACQYQKRDIVMVLMVAVLTWHLQFLAAAGCYTPQKELPRLHTLLSHSFFPTDDHVNHQRQCQVVKRQEIRDCD